MKEFFSLYFAFSRRSARRICSPACSERRPDFLCWGFHIFPVFPVPRFSQYFFLFSVLIFSQGCCLGLLGCFTGMASLLEVVTLIWVGTVSTLKNSSTFLSFAFSNKFYLGFRAPLWFSAVGQTGRRRTWRARTTAWKLRCSLPLFFRLSAGWAVTKCWSFNKWQEKLFQGLDRDLHHPWLLCLLLGMLQGSKLSSISTHINYLNECFKLTLKLYPFLLKSQSQLSSKTSYLTEIDARLKDLQLSNT